MRQVASTGNRYIGRKLWHVFNAAGFHNIEVEGVVTQSADCGVEAFLQHTHPDRMLPLVTHGLLSEEQLDRFRGALTAFAAVPEAYTL